MSLLFLLFRILFLKGAIACLTNVPSYLHGEWIDDPIVPDWKLRGSDGFSSILLVMKNYTFTCHGQVTTWYYWWRVNYAVSGCEVVFTPYVLRYQPQDRLRSDTNCSVTVLGYSRNVHRFFRSETVVHRRPYVIAGEGRGIDVQPGDFIALQIELGHGCRSYTQVWLRGKISPNTVFFKRHSPEEHLDVCAIAPFYVLDSAMGFISAYVEPTSEIATSISAVPSMQILATSEVVTSTSAVPSMQITATSEVVTSTSAVPSMQIAATTEVVRSTSAVPSMQITATSEVVTSTLAVPSMKIVTISGTFTSTVASLTHLASTSTTESHRATATSTKESDKVFLFEIEVIRTTATRIMESYKAIEVTRNTATSAKESYKAIEVTRITATSMSEAIEVTKNTFSMNVTPSTTADLNSGITIDTTSLSTRATPTTNTFDTLEGIILLAVVGSLLITIIMLGICLTVVGMYMWRRKSSTQRGRRPQSCDITSNVAYYTTSTKPSVHEYDYIINKPHSDVKDNPAYGDLPAMFTSYL